MFTSKVWTDDSRLLQETNLTTRQPYRAPHHITQATTSEGLAQGPYVVARVGLELADTRHRTYHFLRYHAPSYFMIHLHIMLACKGCPWLLVRQLKTVLLDCYAVACFKVGLVYVVMLLTEETLTRKRWHLAFEVWQRHNYCGFWNWWDPPFWSIMELFLRSLVDISSSTVSRKWLVSLFSSVEIW